ncbi:hypothetical protein AB5N19_04566 [Seiridium cardinale]
MPIFRGLDISIVASTEAKSLPEYPHPDGSSVRLVSPDAAPFENPSSPRQSEFSILSDGDPTRQRKVHPRVSVYIPSMPGEQFWLRYNILRTPPPATHLYFKMYMNGALITSWGILVDVEKTDQPRRSIGGTVVKALYEPGERWQNTGMDTEGRAIGIETRYFHFMPGLEKRSVAEDGGLIEVQVFRSKGRRRRAPRMVEFRNQERYGIASPSGGLVENPQDATYYDWLLIDPKDGPYASFRFHYRSMKYLVQLNLIPQTESRLELPRSDSGFSIERELPAKDSTTSEPDSPITPRAFEIESSDTAIRKDSNNRKHTLDGIIEDHTIGKYSPRSPLELAPAAATAEQVEHPGKAFRNSFSQTIIDRPLPDLPKPRSRHASESSVHSACPSLTPSLVNYVDDGNFGDDEIRIGTAHTVLCSTPSMIELPYRRSDIEEGDSISDYEHSPPSSVVSSSQDLPSPERYMSRAGSVLEQDSSQCTGTAVMQPSPQRLNHRLPVSVSENGIFGDTALPSSPMSLTLSESEWMRRTPSPVQRKPLSRLWSPRLGKKPTTLTPKDSKKMARHSDIGPYSSSDSLDGFGEEKCQGQINGTAGLSAQELSEDAITPRLAQFPAHCLQTLDLSSSMECSHEHNTWESCRDPTSHEHEVVEKPAGNWI